MCEETQARGKVLLGDDWETFGLRICLGRLQLSKILQVHLDSIGV